MKWHSWSCPGRGHTWNNFTKTLIEILFKLGQPTDKYLSTFFVFWFRFASYISSRLNELLLIAVSQGPASIPAQLAPAAAMQSLPGNSTIRATRCKLALNCYPCKGKEWLSSSAICLSSNSKNRIVQHWNPNLLLLGSSAKGPPATFLLRPVTLHLA